jgi:hypothetical protein
LWQLFYAASKAERLRFLARSPGLMARVWRFQRRRPISAADRGHVLRWFNHQTGVYEFLSRRAAPADVFLFDEGFFHRVVQLFASERETPAPEDVRAYVALLPRPDLVIYPVAPLDTCLQRVYARGLWDRFVHKSVEDTARFMIGAERAVILAVEIARERHWPIIEIDNAGDDPAAARSMLRRALTDCAPKFALPTLSQPVLS